MLHKHTYSESEQKINRTTGWIEVENEIFQSNNNKNDQQQSESSKNMRMKYTKKEQH